MKGGINKVIILGNVGKDPEVKTFGSGSSVCKLAIATSESWKDKQTGENKEQTEWHNVSLFNKLAEIGGKYLTKGSQVYVEGKLRTRKWQDKNGNDRYTTEIIASDMQMIGGKSSGNSAPKQKSVEFKDGKVERDPDFDDDIPF